jgi:histidine triad (HIT) family protein
MKLKALVNFQAQLANLPQAITNNQQNKSMASIFSRIVAGEIPSYKVAEDERFYAFLDINPLTKGHTLVIPKQEIDYLFDLDDKTLGDMMIFAKGVAKKIKQNIDCARVAVVVLGMEVPHAHIHLIPINSEKDVDFHKEKLKLSPEEFAEIATELSK